MPSLTALRSNYAPATLASADEQGNLTASTHWWGLQELAIADERKLLVLPIKEEGVEARTGIGGDYQSIGYRPEEREKCSVAFVKALGKWHSVVLKHPEEPNARV